MPFKRDLVVEIPLFHVLNARITFGNIFAMDSPVPYVGKVQEEDRVTCILDEAIFQIPAGYTQIGNGKVQAPFYFSFIYLRSFVILLLHNFTIGTFVSRELQNNMKSIFAVGADVRRQYSMEEEDDLLQFAIQQSLIEAGTEREEVSLSVGLFRLLFLIVVI